MASDLVTPTARASRYEAVRDLVNAYVDDPQRRSLIMCAVAEYGYASACQGIDDVIAARQAPILGTADILDVVGERR